MTTASRFTTVTVWLVLFASYGFAQKLQTIVQPAQVEPFETASIFAKASGFVSVVNVDIGDKVEKGTILAELSIPEMDQERLQQEALVGQSEAAIHQSEAMVASAKAKVAFAGSQLAAVKAHLEKHSADIAFARSELTRITTLVSSRAINASMQDEKQQQLRSAEAAMTSAQADVKSAESNILVTQANLKQAEADLAFAHSRHKVAEASLAHTLSLMQYATIRAPFAGQISQRTIHTGDFVLSAASAKGDSLFTLNRIDRFRIVFAVPESNANQIQLGQNVELKVDSVKGKVFAGTIQRISGELESRTRTMRVEAEVKDETNQLRPGMYGMITTTITVQ